MFGLDVDQIGNKAHTALLEGARYTDPAKYHHAEYGVSGSPNDFAVSGWMVEKIKIARAPVLNRAPPANTMSAFSDLNKNFLVNLCE